MRTCVSVLRNSVALSENRRNQKILEIMHSVGHECELWPVFQAVGEQLLLQGGDFPLMRGFEKLRELAKIAFFLAYWRLSLHSSTISKYKSPI